jgi:hypothetical protein
LPPADNHAARIAERATFLRDIANDLFAGGVFDEKKILLRGGRLPLLAQAYFILNECYKNWRIAPGHFTEIPKIAALQSLAILTLEPFRPIDNTNVVTVAEARCNEIFALAAAGAVLGFPINPDVSVKRDFWLRLLDILSSAQCQTLEPFRVDANMQLLLSMEHYYRTVNELDKPIINCLICIFELLSDKFRPV